MRAFINLSTLEVTVDKPTEPHIMLNITVEDAEDGRDEFDKEVEVILLVPPGIFLKVALAPQPAPDKMN